MHKPRGLHTSNKPNPNDRSAKHRRNCMGAWLQELSTEMAGGKRLHHVGRLDRKTTGLLFATSEPGSFGRWVCTPGMLSKTYLATAPREAAPALVNSLVALGITLADGFAAALAAEVVSVARETIEVSVADAPAPAPDAESGGTDRTTAQGKKDAKAAKKAEAKRTRKARAETYRQLAAAEKAATVAPPLFSEGDGDGEEQEGSHHPGPTISTSSSSPPLPPRRGRALWLAECGAEMKRVETVTSTVRITVDIGRNHIVKRLLHAIGLPVTSLHRSAVGCHTEASLGVPEPGQARRLSTEEVRELWRCGRLDEIAANFDDDEN